ncbi:hypothetical protein OAH18_02580 [bacterium]|nr:hypothetical protein [bacterium]
MLFVRLLAMASGCLFASNAATWGVVIELFGFEASIGPPVEYQVAQLVIGFLLAVLATLVPILQKLEVLHIPKPRKSIAKWQEDVWGFLLLLVFLLSVVLYGVVFVFSLVYGDHVPQMALALLLVLGFAVFSFVHFNWKAYVDKRNRR